MNHDEFNHVLRQAASAGSLASPVSLRGAIMARVRVDDGRERRWRSFVRWIVVIGAGSGLAAACAVGWSLASRDTTHNQPPPMPLFQEGTP